MVQWLTCQDNNSIEPDYQEKVVGVKQSYYDIMRLGTCCLSIFGQFIELCTKYSG